MVSLIARLPPSSRKSCLPTRCVPEPTHDDDHEAWRRVTAWEQIHQSL